MSRSTSATGQRGDAPGQLPAEPELVRGDADARDRSGADQEQTIGIRSRRVHPRGVAAESAGARTPNAAVDRRLEERTRQRVAEAVHAGLESGCAYKIFIMAT